ILPTWNSDCGTHIIEKHTRSFIKHINKLEHQLEWSTSRPIKDLRFGASSYLTDAACIKFDNIKNSNCRSLKTSNQILFAAKLMNDLLPTKDLLLHRYKNININANCEFCHTHIETLSHMVMCPALQNEWDTICKNSVTKLQRTFKKVHDTETNFSD